ncbi:MAG: acetyl-CoA carboxylase biotin carboxyl carrier protein subunit [Ignavibacteria bacterium]
MITKVEIQNFLKEFLLRKEELKDFASSLYIQQLSKNYFICKKDNKVFEFVLDKDESGNIILYYKGQIFLMNITTLLSENNSQFKREIQKEVLIKSPMPGLISKINVEVGTSIKKGTGLLKIEAMKMENEIKSPVDGIVEALNVQPGVVVEKNTVLLIIKSQ